MTNNCAFALVVGAAVALGPACRAGRRPPDGTARPPGAAGEAIARVGDLAITVGDVQNRINAQPPVVRSQYASLDKKKQLVTDLINFELMAAEAVRRGYDRDPDVVRMMKQQMIGKLVQKDLEAKVKTDDVSAADIARYYDEHARDFRRPEQVQVSQILIKDRARAARVAAEARALPREDAKAFRDLVSRYSEDEDSKARGGDIGPFDRGSDLLPDAAVRAAFALKGAGEMTELIPTEEGFRILRLAARVPGYTRPLTDVTAQIRQQLIQTARTKAVTDFVGGLRAQHPVVIDERNLAKVAIDTSVSFNQRIAIEPRRRGSSRPGVPGL